MEKTSTDRTAFHFPRVRILRGLGLLLLLALLALALLLAAMWFEHRGSLELPRPSGPFGVGRANLHWIFPGHPDELAPIQGAPRELLLWVWYPSAPTTGATADYLPTAWRDALAKRAGILMTSFLTRDLAQVRVHSREGAPVSPARAKYPVVILRGGLSAPVAGYTTIAEELASQGYVVIGMDAPYRTSIVVFPDGRTVSLPAAFNLELMPEGRQVEFARRLAAMWSQDIGLVLDRLASLDATGSSPFAGRLDLAHVGVVGHSMGGATAARFCHDDPRCQAGIDLDGRLFGNEISQGLSKPFMFLLEDHRGYDDGDHIIADIEATYSKSAPESRLMFSVAGANHFSFSDQILLKSQIVISAMRWLHVAGPLEGTTGLRITVDCVRSFFDVYLRGQPHEVLDSLPRRHPELILQ